MNDSSDSLSDDGDDRSLEEFLSHVKRVEPPLESRVEIRTAVAVELCRLATGNRSRPLAWWRRTVAVPVPLALSLAALLLTTSVLQWNSRRGSVPPSVDAASAARRAGRVGDMPHEHAPVARHALNLPPAVEYYETETYLCGIGRLSSQTMYLIKE